MDGGGKSSNRSNSIHRHRHDEAYHLDDCNPPGKARPMYTHISTVSLTTQETRFLYFYKRCKRLLHLQLSQQIRFAQI